MNDPGNRIKKARDCKGGGLKFQQATKKNLNWNPRSSIATPGYGKPWSHRATRGGTSREYVQPKEEEIELDSVFLLRDKGCLCKNGEEVKRDQR